MDQNFKWVVAYRHAPAKLRDCGNLLGKLVPRIIVLMLDNPGPCGLRLLPRSGAVSQATR